jgi:hypothetical protein
MSCGIFVQFIDLGQICILYRKLYIVNSRRRISRARGGYQTYGRVAARSTTLMDSWRRVRNNREDDDGFEYSRNRLTFTVS